MIERRKKNTKNLRNLRDHGFSFLEVTIVMAIVMVMAAMAIPRALSLVRELRTSGDARDLNSAILLAKMRAAADYAHAQVHVDLNSQTFWVEVQPAGTTTWTTEGGTQYLSDNATFGFGSLSSPPSGTQSTLAQAPACSGFTNSACITFNSRGIPIDSTNAPVGNDAIYITDGRTVTGVTVAATGLTRVWRTEASTANWKQR